MAHFASELVVHVTVELSVELCKKAMSLGKEARRQYLLYKERREKGSAATEASSTTPSPPCEDEEEKEEWGYEGNFVDGELEGKGKMTSPTKTYEGMFHKGVFHGEGTITYTKTGRKYVGEFENGTYHGSGVYFGNSFTYAGTFKEGDFVHGLICMPNGARFEGECEKYAPKQGTFLTKRGYKYIGALNKFNFEGYGKLIYPIRHLETGELTTIVYYEGNFIGGKLNGQGVMVWRNGKKWRGEWVDSKMVKTNGAYEEPTPEELALSAYATM
jgi:hypothetical protein